MNMMKQNAYDFDDTVFTTRPKLKKLNAFLHSCRNLLSSSIHFARSKKRIFAYQKFTFSFIYDILCSILSKGESEISCSTKKCFMPASSECSNMRFQSIVPFPTSVNGRSGESAMSLTCHNTYLPLFFQHPLPLFPSRSRSCP